LGNTLDSRGQIGLIFAPMGVMQILTGTGALTFVALGLAMARFEELTAAYWLFWASAASATWGGLWWELTSLDTLPIRMAAGFVTGIFVFVILPMLFRWLHKRQVKAGPPRPDISSAQ
jgi:hypothetical protein